MTNPLLTISGLTLLTTPFWGGCLGVLAYYYPEWTDAILIAGSTTFSLMLAANAQSSDQIDKPPTPSGW